VAELEKVSMALQKDLTNMRSARVSHWLKKPSDKKKRGFGGGPT
jgi:hypothetical protein